MDSHLLEREQLAQREREISLQGAQRVQAERASETATRARILASKLLPTPIVGQPSGDRAQALHNRVAYAAAVRLGSLGPACGTGSPGEWPLVVPLLDGGNLAIIADSTQTSSAQEVVRSTVYQALRGTAPGQLRVAVIDPTMSTTLGPLDRLTGDLKVHKAVTPQQIGESLTVVTARIAENAALLQGRWDSIGDFRSAHEDEELRPFELLVVLDYPRGFDEQTHASLAILAKRGPLHGLSVVVHFNTSERIPRDVDPVEILGQAEVIDLGVTTTWRRAPSFPVELDSSVDNEAFVDLCAAVEDAARNAGPPVVPLSAVTPPATEMWKSSSATGIEVEMGLRSSEVVRFTLGGGDSQENLNHVLVGGSIGSGKSNVLLTMIYGVASRYSPQEVEMYLLDFKEGVEFARFADEDTYLPHARIVGMEADAEVGSAVLEGLMAEYRSRSARFKDVGNVKDLAAFRSKTGEVLPRILLVIDEFQMMFTGGASGERNVELLEDLMRRARSAGIHVVLASQTLTGLAIPGSKRDAIFSQVVVRIGLQTSAQESEVVLGLGHKEAAELNYRGQAILRKTYKLNEETTRFMVAHADGEALARVDEELHRFAAVPGRKGPMAVRRGQFASPVEGFSLLRRHGPMTGVALLGEPLAPGLPDVAAELGVSGAQHLVIGGSGTEEAVGLLRSAALSVAMTTEPARFVLLHSSSGLGVEPLDLDDLAAGIATFRHEVVHATSEDELIPFVKDADDRRTIIVGIALDQLPFNPSGFGGQPGNALEEVIAPL